MGSGTPASSVSRVATRVMVNSGASQRTASSIACGMSDRSERTASSCSGLESNPNSRFPVERYVVSTPAGSRRRRNEKISSSERCSPSISASCEAADEVVAGLLPPRRENRREVLPQRRGGGDRALAVDDDAEQRDRPALELWIVGAGQAQEASDDLSGVREGELPDEVGAPAFDESVDQLVGDPLDQLVLPARERLL